MNVEKRWGFGTVVRVDPSKNHLIDPADPRRWMVITVARSGVTPWKLMFLGPSPDNFAIGLISNWPSVHGRMRVDDDV